MNDWTTEMMAAKSPPPEELPDTLEVVRSVRLRNGRILLEEAGSVAQLCALLGITRQRAHSFLRPNPPRNIGYDLARRMEQVFNRPANWMDYSNDEPSLLADAFEKIERDGTSRTDKIAKMIRAAWDEYKKRTLEKERVKVQSNNPQGSYRQTQRGEGNVIEDSVRQHPTKRRRTKRHK